MTFEEWWEHFNSCCPLNITDNEIAEYAWEAATCNVNLQLGRCDQYKNEALAMRKALGFSTDSENVAPIDLLNKLDEVVSSKLTPEGYVLVPIEPTENMWLAGRSELLEHYPSADEVYKAMIKAAQESFNV